MPCPIEDLIYPDSFLHKIRIAYWFNVPAFLCQVFLLVTFAVLQKEKSQRHYLSIGLCFSMIMLEVRLLVLSPNETLDGKVSRG